MTDIVTPPELRALTWATYLLRSFFGVIAALFLSAGLLLCVAAVFLPLLPFIANRVPASQINDVRFFTAAIGAFLILFGAAAAAAVWLLVRVVQLQRKEFERIVATAEPQRARLEIHFDYMADAYCVRLFHPGEDICFREFLCSFRFSDEKAINGEEVDAYIGADPDDVVAVKTSRGWIWSSPPLSRVFCVKPTGTWRAR